MSQLYIDQGRETNGQKVALCTPVYDSPSPGYVFSIQRSRQALSENGIESAYFLLTGNCHVDDARNSLVQEFLLSDCTELVFLDADVAWEPSELIKLCQFDVDIVGGIYPYRKDSEASKEIMPVITIPGVVEPENGLLEVAGLPTGFMKIKRHVIETLAIDANQYWARNDRRMKIPILFERTFDNGARWGGDLSFCKKWVAKGGKLHAAADLHLGHIAVSTIYDSLSAALRRQGKETLTYMIDRIKTNEFDPTLFSEARRFIGNQWGALEDVLMLCAIMGKKADGPIIETGSGLTTLVLAASTDQKVYCLEHHKDWFNTINGMIQQSGLKNIEVKLCDIKDGWYVLPNDIPSEFSLGLNDGPPRVIGSRMGFFDHFGGTKTIICDDADDPGYADSLSKWCQNSGKRIDFIERSALIRG
jgi:hypothetical protein